MSKSTFDNGVPAAGSADGSRNVYEALASERRRYVLAVVAAAEETLDIDTLARRVAAREADESTESVADDLQETVSLSLYHHHLPKLADMNLVEYEAEESMVTGLTETGAALSG